MSRLLYFASISILLVAIGGAQRSLALRITSPPELSDFYIPTPEFNCMPEKHIVEGTHMFTFYWEPAHRSATSSRLDWSSMAKPTDRPIRRVEFIFSPRQSVQFSVALLIRPERLLCEHHRYLTGHRLLQQDRSCSSLRLRRSSYGTKVSELMGSSLSRLPEESRYRLMRRATGGLPAGASTASIFWISR